MHALYFVILDQDDAADSRGARNIATTILIEENFCYQDGFFGSGKADWFTVGGRWSGILQLVKLGISVQDFDNLSEEGKTICWTNNGGDGPYPGSQRRMSGKDYDDDTMILTKRFYRKLVTAYPDTEVYDARVREETRIRDLKLRDVMNQWLVVIDYHR